MNWTGRILIVDDAEDWREELVETLRRGGFHVDSASTVDEARVQLEGNFYHVLVLDICMHDPDLSNIEGIELLAELDERGLSEAAKVVMLSAYGTIERMRTSFRQYKVVDFLSKPDFDNQEFLGTVQRIFAQDVKVNLALDVQWQGSNGAELVVLNLMVNGKRIRRNTLFQSQMAAELEDLLCRLFCQATSIIVRPLASGHSGTGVLRVQPFYATGGGGHEVIVKFGDFRKVEEEYRNFKRYVQPFLGGGRSTTILDLRRTVHLGGIVYSLLGTIKSKNVSFGEFYRDANIAKIRGVLERLFHDTCGPWYANRGNLQPLNLTEDYQRLFDYSPERLEQILFDQLKTVQGKRNLYFRNLKGEHAFPNPLLATTGLSLVRPTYKCITHGDFNQHNLFVDSAGYVWLIDFQGTGQSHILRDVSALDSALRFQLLTATEATLEERLQMEEVLCSIEYFSQLDQLPANLSTENRALAKCYATVMHLRKLARKLVDQNPGDDLSEYYIALLYNAMNTIRFTSLPSLQREHALLCASLLVDRMGLIG